MKLATSITVALLLFATIIEWGVDQKTPNHIIAEKHIGKCEAVNFLSADAFQSSSKTAILFKCKGFQGPIEALLIISNNEIEKLLILKSNEGLDKLALNNSKFLKAFQQNVLDLPIGVDAVAGATISSQLVIDEVNRYINEWNKKDD